MIEEPARLAALHHELLAVCAQYDDALREIQRLTDERQRLVQNEAVLRDAVASARRSVQELAEREREFRRAAEMWARDSQTLVDEIETASLVQRFMVQQDRQEAIEGLEVVSSYRPAAQTGGDWLGFDRDADAFTILIGDVMGHGLPASLLTAGAFGAIETLRAVELTSPPSTDVRTQRSDLRRPERLLSVLHEVIKSMGGGRYGMTFLAARYEARHRSFHIANASHPPPLWVPRHATSSAHAQTLHSPAGTPLGVTTGPAAWAEKQTIVSTGDLLLFYTDGLTEAVDVKGRTLGPRRVADWLLEARDRSMESARDLLQSRFDDYVAGRAVRDDVSFILVRVCR